MHFKGSQDSDTAERARVTVTLALARENTV
jgi:hypothetical protein